VVCCDDLRHRSGVFEYVTGTERGSVKRDGRSEDGASRGIDRG
jgi:hypothetical protein